MVRQFKFRDWRKKPRTMLRFIKPGDIFSFQIEDNLFGFGQIIADSMMGHSAEIFNYFNSSPEISKDNIIGAKRLISPIILDSYTLFDKKLEGDWRIIGHEENYNPKDIDGFFFKYGDPILKKVDLLGSVTSTNAKEAEKYPYYTSQSDYDIKNLIQLQSLENGTND
ncbi:hypothetical protein XA3_00790 [Xylocopilactobacillus apicola]|uniref:Phosphotriesterase n=2 Tax=Xylocopilactobacillus apicola TaxID=2932184 RepID=A0AAU9DR59_9LACO|nr:hypothetical protein XA3_00790 [Xylocopilactobacillus apicola]